MRIRESVGVAWERARRACAEGLCGVKTSALETESASKPNQAPSSLLFFSPLPLFPPLKTKQLDRTLIFRHPATKKNHSPPDFPARSAAVTLIGASAHPHTRGAPPPSSLPPSLKASAPDTQPLPLSAPFNSIVLLRPPRTPPRASTREPLRLSSSSRRPRTGERHPNQPSPARDHERKGGGGPKAQRPRPADSDRASRRHGGGAITRRRRRAWL